MKVAVISGSTRGIGRAVAKQLAAEGTAVVVNGRNEEDVAVCTAELQHDGACAFGYAADVSQQSEVERMAEAVMAQYGRIDILVNNAGIVRDALFAKMAVEDWQSVLDVHLNGTFYLTKAILPHMKAQGQGVILNVTSLAGLRGVVGQANYATAKAGVLGLTWTLSQELARYHIRVNAISPAALTDMTRPYVERARAKAEEQGFPLPSYWEIGSSADVARVVGFLCSDAAESVTGQVIGVNGAHLTHYEQPKERVLTSFADLLA